MSKYKCKLWENTRNNNESIFYNAIQEQNICGQILNSLMEMKYINIQKFLVEYIFMLNKVMENIYCNEENVEFDTELEVHTEEDLENEIRTSQLIVDAKIIVSFLGHEQLQLNIRLFIYDFYVFDNLLKSYIEYEEKIIFSDGREIISCKSLEHFNIDFEND